MGANVEARDRYGETIFMRAVRDNDLALASLLVEYGANVDAANEQGFNALMLAASENRLPMVRFLFDTAGCNVMARSKYGGTPLTEAAEMGAAEVVEYLVRVVRLDMEEKNRRGFSALTLAGG